MKSLVFAAAVGASVVDAARTGVRGVVALPALATSELSSTAGLEDSMMALLESDNGNTPELAQFVRSIQDLLDTQMKPKVLANRDAQQAQVNRLFDAFASCPTSLSAAQNNASKILAQFTALSQQHKQCRGTQSSLATGSNLCTTAKNTADSVKTSACKAVTDLDNSKSSLPGSCSPNAGEDYGQLAARLQAQFASAKAVYAERTKACADATAALAAKVAECAAGDRALADKKTECDNTQGQLDSASCSYVTALNTACKALDTCYDQTLGNFNAGVTAAKAQEAGLKTEFDAILRLQCLTNVFRVADESRADAIQACRGTNYAAELAKLSLNYPTAPTKTACDVPTDGAGSSAYQQAQYTSLPANAPAKACAATCCQGAGAAPSDGGGLLAYYPLNQDFKDASGNRRDGTPVGNVQPSGAGSSVSGGSFIRGDWASGYNWGSALSVCVRFQRTVDNGKYMGIVTTGYHSSGAWEIRIGREGCSTGTCTMLGGGVSTAASPNTWDAHSLSANLRQWTHVCQTYDGTTYNFYLNGKLASSSKADSGPIVSKSKPLYIGIADAGSHEFFDGLIQHVRIYSKALSAGEVSQIFASDK